MRTFPRHLLTADERRLFTKLNTPSKIQDYINTFPYNNTDSLRSMRYALQSQELHCFEGALLATALLWFHGHAPLLLDLSTTKHDDDHVVALFKKDGLWGTISATHHSVLRFRDPLFKNMREIALSYFHEYFLNSGNKTLRTFSKKPFSLLPYDDTWLTGNEDLYEIGADLDDAPHESIVPAKLIRHLRKADTIERLAANTLPPAEQRKTGPRKK